MAILVITSILHTVGCGAPPPPVNGFLQPHTNTTVGSVVVFQCDPGFVPVGEMTAVCGSDSQWTPNPGGVTCSPRPAPTFTQATTPTLTSTPTSKNYTLHFIMCMLLTKEHRERVCRSWNMSGLESFGWLMICCHCPPRFSQCHVIAQSSSLVEISLIAFYPLLSWFVLSETVRIKFIGNICFKSAHKLQSKQRLLKPYVGFPFPHIDLTPAIPTPQSVVVPVVVAIVFVLVICCVVIIIIVGVVIVRRRQSSKYSVLSYDLVCYMYFITSPVMSLPVH